MNTFTSWGGPPPSDSARMAEDDEPQSSVDPWARPCAPKGLANACVFTQTSGPMTHFKLYILGGDPPRRSKPNTASLRTNPENAKRKIGRSSLYRGGTFWVSAFRLRTRDGRGFWFVRVLASPASKLSTEDIPLVVGWVRHLRQPAARLATDAS